MRETIGVNQTMRTIGVKFCGGCHPGFDRGKVFREMKERYRDYTFVIAEENILYDDLLFLCGCTSRCASYQPYRMRNRRVWIDHKPDKAEMDALFDMDRTL